MSVTIGSTLVKRSKLGIRSALCTVIFNIFQLRRRSCRRKRKGNDDINEEDDNEYQSNRISFLFSSLVNVIMLKQLVPIGKCTLDIQLSMTISAGEEKNVIRHLGSIKKKKCNSSDLLMRKTNSISSSLI